MGISQVFYKPEGEKYTVKGCTKKFSMPSYVAKYTTGTRVTKEEIILNDIYGLLQSFKIFDEFYHIWNRFKLMRNIHMIIKECKARMDLEYY